ncbi:MAG: ABC transporter ATP-binding protein [Pirellulales bacterium]
MPPAIVVENLGKSYRVQHQQTRGGYKTLRESLTSAAARPLNRLRRRLDPQSSLPDPTSETFWALSDVNFEVQPGEVVGIIGRNGAGKSTLLKILSRITKPTTGRVTINGRVGSLLEVGTGFHPELTGRENIFMNGSILGMSRREIQRKFDEIVDFSGVERFLDTPVKRFSSGMQVRLAFAVAAHLEPEIIIVDEVLAVGDMEFQRKCLGKMGDVANSGRTVFFVSHNMAAIESLCESGILMERGRIASHGPIHNVVGTYCETLLAATHRNSHHGSNAPLNGVIRSVQLVDRNSGEARFIKLGDDLLLSIQLDLPNHDNHPTIGVGFDDLSGTRLLTVHTPLTCVVPGVRGHCRVVCHVPRLPLPPGDYWIKVAVSGSGVSADSLDRALLLHISEGDPFHDGRGFTRGYCIARSEWRVVPL